MSGGTLVLTHSHMKDLLSMPEVIPAVEQAFAHYARGEAQMPAKVYVSVEKGDFRAMPAAVPGAACVKWVNVHPGNPAVGLPTVMAIIIYSDAATGYPLAVMDGTEVTAFRTGAVAAVASKYLARKRPATLGLVGAGRQARTQLQAHLELFGFESIRVYDHAEAAVDRFMAAFPGRPVHRASLEETCASDIVCTVTPATAPVVKRGWIRPGTHINAMGADAPGKEELEPSLLRAASVVVDDIRQASEAGEINVPISTGLYTKGEVYGTLGEIVAGIKPGRTDDSAITIFDSTGLAIQDLAAAQVVYGKAKARGGYLTVKFD